MNRFPILVLPMLALGLVGAPQAGQALSCAQGPYMVFFTSGSAVLKEDARAILDNAISAVDNCGPTHQLIAGHTDTAEAPNLADKRARTVRAYFIAHGVPEDDIDYMGFGATKLRVATAAQVSEKQNRRVEVIFVPPTEF